MSPVTSKIALRREMRARLAQMDVIWRAAASQRIFEQVSELKCWQDAGVVGLFTGRNDEVDTRFYWPSEKCLALPRIDGENMEFVAVEDVSRLDLDSFGLPIPVVGPVILPELLLVPGLAFDASGGRLGRGKGFYDRWMAKYPQVKTIGICFDFQVLDAVPAEPHDRRVGAVLSDIFP